MGHTALGQTYFGCHTLSGLRLSSAVDIMVYSAPAPTIALAPENECFPWTTRTSYLPPATKLRPGNVFTPVCQSFCSQGRGCLPLVWRDVCQIHLGRHPLGRHPPWVDTHRHPLAKHSLPSAFWDTLFLAQCMLGFTHTPCAVHAGIRPTSGRYASHWNAFLFARTVKLNPPFISWWSVAVETILNPNLRVPSFSALK